MITIIEHGAIRELRLTRPPANALTSELLSQLRDEVVNAPSHGVRALVLSGAPGMFSAGLDIPALLQLRREQIADLWRKLYQALGALACSSIPVCAAVTGHAPAGGTVLAIYCDWRIGAQGAFKIGLSEVQVGLPLPPIILQCLRRLVGAHQAERLATRGLLMESEEARRIGLLDEVVPPENVVPRAIHWSGEMLAIPPNAMAYTRQQARADLRAIFERDLNPEIDEMDKAWWQPETQAMLRAVVERLAKKKMSVSS
jgi:enoyl-CoA hydratase/carnithine racemase